MNAPHEFSSTAVYVHMEGARAADTKHTGKGIRMYSVLFTACAYPWVPHPPHHQHHCPYTLTTIATNSLAAVACQVYTWFLGVYWVSRTVGIAGYVLLILDMFGVGLLLSWLLPPGTSLLLLWYGLYFGILGRDCAEVASDQMASVMGSGSKLTSTVHNCGICGGELKDYSHLGEEVGWRGGDSGGRSSVWLNLRWNGSCPGEVCCEDMLTWLQWWR
jgi:hypothetical protein